MINAGGGGILSPYRVLVPNMVERSGRAIKQLIWWSRFFDRGTGSGLERKTIDPYFIYALINRNVHRGSLTIGVGVHNPTTNASVDIPSISFFERALQNQTIIKDVVVFTSK